MIAPNMATMLCFVTTDAEIDSETLHDALSEAVDASFNRICIDNDMSTNDTVLCLANGASEVRLEPDSDELAEFTAMLTVVCQDLAKRLVKDGEGATKFVEIEVDGADSDRQARMIAKSIATSMLTKTAFFGQDPNWGRIICATGYAGVDFDPAAISLWLDDLQLVANGVPTQFAEEDAARRMQQSEFVLRLCVGSGEGKAWYWTSDLSHDYVTINADYRT